MHHYAQTSDQLLEQLWLADYSEPELEAAVQAYELASRLFVGRHRAGGKTFLSHLVGTASILAEHGARPAVVLAGLLHAAYDQGLFFTAQTGATEANRGRLRSHIGNEAENLVFEFTRLDWETWGDTSGRSLAHLPPQLKDTLLIRVANELEDVSSIGLWLSREHRRRWTLDRLPLAIQLAEELNFPELARQIVESEAHYRSLSVPDSLRRDYGSSYSVSPSLRLRIRWALSQRCKKLAGWVTSVGSQDTIVE